MTETQTHTPGPWAVGRTLTTPQTREWNNAKWVENDLREGKLVFASFSAKDQGRGRELVAECRTLADAKLTAAAPELLDALRTLLGTSGHYLAPDEVLAADFNCPTAWIVNARAAIEKATP